MKSFPVIFAFFLMAYAPVKAQQILSYTKAMSTGKDSLPYRLLYPLNYNKYKRYPLVLFLHGAGQRGTQ